MREHGYKTLLFPEWSTHPAEFLTLFIFRGKCILQEVLILDY